MGERLYLKKILKGQAKILERHIDLFSLYELYACTNTEHLGLPGSMCTADV